MTDTPKGLTPANQNPWYVLMTLYGEQEGEEIDEALHAKNRAAWNAWACQGMGEEERAKAAASSGVTVEELLAWPQMKDEVERRHKAAWERRNGKTKCWPGIPVAGHVVLLGSVLFGNHISMNQTVFSGDALFGHSEFLKTANFRLATIQRSAFFGDASFNGSTWFAKATFQKEAYFPKANFVGLSGFSEAKFNQLAMFDRATFRGDAAFDKVVFYGEAWFDNTKFWKSARFHMAKFDQLAWFGETLFRATTTYFGSSFGGRTYFKNAAFGCAGEHQHVSFLDCQFEKPTNYIDAVFHATYPDFSGAILHDKTAFTDHPDNWPKGPQPDMAAAKASCAIIRHNLGKQGLPEAEHFFFRREMGFAGQNGGWWQKLPYRAFGAFSDYGYSIARPSLWLLSLWVAVAMVNHVVLQWGASMSTVADYHPVQAFGLSFANLFPVFGLHKLWFDPAFLTGLNGWLKFLGGVQTIASLPLLFFLGLGLRTRFRLR